MPASLARSHYGALNREFINELGVKDDASVDLLVTAKHKFIDISSLLVRVTDPSDKFVTLIVRPSPLSGMYWFARKIHETIMDIDYWHDFNVALLTKDGWAAYKESPEDDLHETVWGIDQTSSNLFLRYFSLSAICQQRLFDLRYQYEIKPRETIGVYFRGTDRSTTHRLPPLQLFFDRIDALPQDAKLLIQTDSGEALASFRERYGSRVTFIRELPVSTMGHGTHQQGLAGRMQHAVTLNAALTILANCRYLIMSDYSNGSYFMQQQRRHDMESYQIDAKRLPDKS